MGLKAEEPDYQKQFEAAVRVIHGLPKDGAYRPSYDEMLSFYSYYKQATIGPCKISKPGFWDPIGRFKWDAWNRLGNMTKEKAMAAYIAQMKMSAQKVIDIVPMDQSSEDMFVYFEPLYEVIPDMPRPPDNFFKKKSGSIHTEEPTRSSQTTSDSDSEMFCDSLEEVESDQTKRLSFKQRFPLTNTHRVQAENKDLQTAPRERDCNSTEVGMDNPAEDSIQQKVDLQMTNTIKALQEDMKKVMERLSHLESLAALQGHTSMSNSSLPNVQHSAKKPPNWPVQLPRHTLIFLLAWPFIVQWLLWRFQNRKR